MDLQTKLETYRAKKNREAKINYVKDKFKNVVNWGKKDDNLMEQEESLIDEEPIIDEPATFGTNSDNETKEDETNESNKQNATVKRTLYITGFLIWASLYYFFIQLQFGIIYLIISMLFGIYFNTRTGPKDENEISAYSVFNKNCESINGTLKGEQLERQMLFGGLGMH